MSACIQCGSQLIERATFCPTCGRPVEVAQAPTQAAYQPGAMASFQPPPPAGYQPVSGAGYQPISGAGYQPVSPAGYAPVSPAAYTPAYAPAGYAPAGYGQPQPGAYMVAGPSAPPRYPGDWAGAIVAVTSGVLVMLATSLIALLIVINAVPDGAATPSASLVTGLTALFAALSLGGSVDDTSSFGSHTSSLSYQFLGPAVLGFALIGLIYARRLRRQGAPTLRAAAIQAARCGAVMAVELVGVILLSKVGTSTEFASESADIGTTLLFGLVTLAITLVLAGFVGLSGLLPAQAERVRAVIAGPLRAVMVMFVMANVLALIGILILVGHEMSVDPPPDSVASQAWAGIAMLLVLALPNVASIALLLGMGVPVSTDIGGSLTSLDGSSAGGSYSILDLTRQNQLFWLWPLVVALLLLLAGFIAGRRSPYTVNGRSTAPVLGAVLPVVLLILALMSSGDATGTGLTELSGHLNLGLTVGFGALWGVLAGLIGMAVGASRRPATPQFYAPPAQAFAFPVPGGYPAPPAGGQPFGAQPPAPGYPSAPQLPTLGYPPAAPAQQAAPAQTSAPPAENYPAGYIPPGYAPPGYAAPGYPPAPPTTVEPPQQPWQGYPQS